MEIIGWAASIVEIIKNIVSLLKKEGAKRKSIAQELIELYKISNQVVIDGKKVVSFLSQLKNEPLPDRMTISYHFYEPPLLNLEMVLAHPTKEELEQGSVLLVKQEENLKKFIKKIQSKKIKNLGIILQDIDLIKVQIVNKFGYVSILLSNLEFIENFGGKEYRSELGRTFLKQTKELKSENNEKEVSEREVIHLGIPEKSAKYLKKVGYNVPEDNWSSFRPKEPYFLIYSNKEIQNAERRIEEINEVNNQLLKLIKESFTIDEIL